MYLFFIDRGSSSDQCGQQSGGDASYLVDQAVSLGGGGGAGQSVRGGNAITGDAVNGCFAGENGQSDSSAQFSLFAMIAVSEADFAILLKDCQGGQGGPASRGSYGQGGQCASGKFFFHGSVLSCLLRKTASHANQVRSMATEGEF